MDPYQNKPIGAVSEQEIEPVLELLQGGDPEVIANRAGITVEKLLEMRDALLTKARDQEEAGERGSIGKKVGRNAPCPCGSGKKYKQCCMESQRDSGRDPSAEQAAPSRATEKEQKRLVENIEKTFALIASERYEQAVREATRLLRKYPNEDRLHDILATAHLYSGACDKAVRICSRRLDAARREKDYFIEHGRYRDAEVEKPALSYYYPPMTWLQKHWIALKAEEYRRAYPPSPVPAIVDLVQEIRTADDRGAFTERHDRGYEARRKALEQPLEELKNVGPEAIAYLSPMACRYCWAGLFVPELLSHYGTDLAIRRLMDISMFGFAYASGASLHYLEKLGARAVPHIAGAFSRDESFDPIKTGLVAVLGNIRSLEAYALLLGLLQHESHHVVNWAGGALGRFERKEALPHLLAAQERIGGEQMIDEAIEKLEAME